MATKNEKNDKPKKAATPEKAAKSEKVTKPEKAATPEKAAKSEKITKPEKAAKPKKAAKPEKAAKSEKIASSEEDARAINKKKTKVAEKLRAMGMMGSEKKSPEKVSNSMSSMWLALIVAIPAAMIVAYVVMPEELSKLLSFPTTVVDERSNDFYAQPQVPSHPYAGNWNQNREPEWVAQKRMEMEKRRLELDRQNADKYAASRVSPELPQWVKDQQALMQKEQKKHQQEWARRSTDMSNKQSQVLPGYMNNQVMNGYPQNRNSVNPYVQNSAPYYGNTQAMNPYRYNRAPYYGQHNYIPNGQNGYPYR